MHYDRAASDFDSVGAGVQIRPVVQIRTVSQFDEIRKAHPHIVLDRSVAVHFQDQLIQQTANRDPNNGWDPPEHHDEKLFIEIAGNGGCLTAQIQADVCEHALRWSICGVLRPLDMIASFRSVRIDGRKQHVVYNESMFPAVFLDRDGVLIENRADYVREWSQVAVYPKTYSSLISIQNAGYKIVIVTNQSAVGRGMLALQTAHELNQRLVELIRENGGRVDGVYLCPHQPEDECDCRKPKPGMLLQAANELRLDFSRSWMIGDAWSDVLAGQAVGVRGTILVQTGRGQDQLSQPHPENLNSFFVATDLANAAQIILANGSP